MHFDLPLMRITTGRMGRHEMVAGPIAAFPVFVRNDTIITKAICKGRLKSRIGERDRDKKRAENHEKPVMTLESNSAQCYYSE